MSGVDAQPGNGRSRLVREARHRAIVEYVARHGSVTVSELTRLLSVSPATARKDLDVLHDHGAVTRTHGGAVSNAGFSLHEPSLDERIHQQVAEKAAIARHCVAQYVEDEDAILLDAGTTTVAIAREIVRRERRVTIITNSLDVAHVLAPARNVELALTGGEHRPGVASLVGDWVTHALSTVRVRTVFLGANAVSTAAGITTPNLQEAAAKQAMLGAAERTILVVDRTKLNCTTFGFVAPVTSVDALVTNAEADPVVLAELRDLGVQVEAVAVAPERDIREDGG
jgi:DeoR family fructose operon transcriptional repressor